MPKHSYFLFPLWMIIISYIVLIFSIIIAFIGLNAGNYAEMISLIPFVLITLIIITFQSVIMVEKPSNRMIKQSKMLGISLSSEKIRIPKECSVILKKKSITGKGYYKAAVGVSYKLNACDMYFVTPTKRLTRIIKTDSKRALKIADFLKRTLDLDYVIMD